MIITLQGVDGKVGTTMVSQSIAEQIAKRESGSKILLLFLNERTGREYAEQQSAPVCIDDFFLMLSERRLKLDDVYNGCWASKTFGNLLYFGGLRQRFQGRQYWPDMAGSLLDAVQDEFQHIIIDTGNNLGFGLAAPDGAPSRCNKLLIVAAQNAVALNNLADMRMYYDKYQLRPAAYIINKYDNDSVYDIPYIKSKADLAGTDVFTLPLLAYNKAMEAERISQTFQEKSWIRGIQNITSFLMGVRE